MNMKLCRQFLTVVLSVLLLLPSYGSYASDPGISDGENQDLPTVAEPMIESDAKSMILIEESTGRVLYEKNADEALPPASVTKIMTLLLVMEAVDAGKLQLDQMVTVSEEAASMGGSQVYLKVGEQLTVEEMIKCVVIASANDAALALAEAVAGSEAAFVDRMNERADELGMCNTHFENTNGLDDTTVHHVISARDIAIMSAALMKHKTILQYTTVWQDSIRNGSFTLTNTNRLIRFYPGANGLKTGSTSKAGFCISAAAKRDSLQLIAVVMGASTSNSRNETAKQLLNWGFANFTSVTVENREALTVPIAYGTKEKVAITYDRFSLIVEKEQTDKIETRLQLNDSINAPLQKGDAVGNLICIVDGKTVKEVPIYATESVLRNSFGKLFWELVKKYLQI